MEGSLSMCSYTCRCLKVHFRSTKKKQRKGPWCSNKSGSSLPSFSTAVLVLPLSVSGPLPYPAPWPPPQVFLFWKKSHYDEPLLKPFHGKPVRHRGRVNAVRARRSWPPAPSPAQALPLARSLYHPVLFLSQALLFPVRIQYVNPQGQGFLLVLFPAQLLLFRRHAQDIFEEWKVICWLITLFSVLVWAPHGQENHTSLDHFGLWFLTDNLNFAWWNI